MGDAANEPRDRAAQNDQVDRNDGRHDAEVVRLGEGPDGRRAARLADAVGVVLQELLGRIDLIIEETWLEIRVLDGYRDLSAVQAEQVRQMIAASLAIFGRHLEAEQQRVVAEDRQFYLGLGASRAWNGICLASLEEAFDVCFQRAHAQMSRIAHQHGELGPDVDAVLSSRLVGLYGNVWDTVTEGHADALADRSTPGTADRSGLVSSVLAGATDPARLLGLLGRAAIGEPSRVGLLVVAACRDGQDGMRNAVGQLVADLPAAVPGVAWSTPTEHVPVVAAAVPNGWLCEQRAALTRWAQRHTVRLVVAEEVDLAELPLACGVVRNHLDAVAVALPGPGVVSVARLVRCAWPGRDDPHGARWLADYLLRPVADLGSKLWDPLATLQAVTDADGVREVAAAVVGLAPETVRKHLIRIRKELEPRPLEGISPDIDLALMLLRKHRMGVSVTDDAKGDDERRPIP